MADFPKILEDNTYYWYVTKSVQSLVCHDGISVECVNFEGYSRVRNVEESHKLRPL